MVAWTLCSKHPGVTAMKPCLLGLVLGGKQGSGQKFLDGKPDSIALLRGSIDPRWSHPLLDLNWVHFMTLGRLLNPSDSHA